MEKQKVFDRSYYTTAGKKWLSSLGELRITNINLKNQLSAAISHKVSHEFVEQVEHFQHLFIEKDQIIDLLRHDINILLHRREPIKDWEERQYLVLEKDIEQLSQDFDQLKKLFADFLGQPQL